MSNLTDNIGKRYGRLIILKETKPSYTINQRQINVLCKCDCGTVKSVRLSHIIHSGTKSCGCLHREKFSRRSHNLSRTRIYRIYRCMRNRCEFKKYPEWHLYGGRGIKICKKWGTFEGFYKSMGESYNQHVKDFGEKDTTIDRINVNGNYTSQNCRWATTMEQAHNKRPKLT